MVGLSSHQTFHIGAHGFDAASRRFVSMHVLVPGFWTLDAGHELLEHLEADIRATLPDVTITTHLEPLDNPASHQDKKLDR